MSNKLYTLLRLNADLIFISEIGKFEITLKKNFLSLNNASNSNVDIDRIKTFLLPSYVSTGVFSISVIFAICLI